MKETLFMPRLLSTAACLLLTLMTLAAAEVPRPCPEFTISLANGKAVSISQYKGKVVVLEVTLTSCPACKRCAKVIQKLYEELGPRGFQPLSVAINRGADKLVAGYIRESQLTYPVGYSQHHQAVNLLQHPILLPLWVPQLVFIDKKGVIRAQYAGTDKFFRNEENNIRAMVEKLLGEKAVP